MLVVDDDPNLYLKVRVPPPLWWEVKKYSMLDIPVANCQCPSCKINYGIK